MYRVLIPTDFSENAFGALHYGAQLFEGFSCTFYLLHVYTPVFRSSRFMASEPRGLNAGGTGREATLENLEETKARIERENPDSGHYYETLASFTLLTEEIAEVAATHRMDLILMTTRGTSDREEVFMGSNGVKVVSRINGFPILLLPPGFKQNSARPGILTTNLQRVCLPADLRNLTKNLGPVFGRNAEELFTLPNNSRGMLVRYLQQQVIMRREFSAEEPILLLPEVSTQPKALAFS